MKHPMQPVEYDDDGVIRFKENKIVRYMLDKGVVTMNDLAIIPFSKEDREHFAQLIGYSVSGFGDLSYASSELVAKADEAADKLKRGEFV